MTARKTRILFAHSAGPQYGKGKGSYDLVKYLRTKLPGYQVVFPTIRQPSKPTYAKFKKMFADSFKKLDGPVVLVGHSLGASTLLKYLSETKQRIPIQALFLVSTPHWGSDMKEFELKENFQDAMPGIPIIFLYHSKKDEDVPFSQLAFYKKAFPNAVVHELPGKEHVFSKGLPVLVRDLNALI